MQPTARTELPLLPAADERGARVAVIGAGPAGLMAAETLSAAGVPVDLYDAMPSPGRKFLMAGRGGLNLTHSEPLPAFVARYGERRTHVAAWLAAFDPDALRAWAHGLGTETFVGSSGRVFPRAMKAAPLLRAWLRRLRDAGVTLHVRHRWTGWDERGALRFETPEGARAAHPPAVILALGGGSWPRLGANGHWTKLLGAQAIPIAPLRPANCGFDVGWSAHFRERYAGLPVKSVTVRCTDVHGHTHARDGEFVITDSGLEGSAIYAIAAPLRDAIAQNGTALLHLDLAPGRSPARLHAEIAHPRGTRSMSSHLQSRAGVRGVKTGLLRECAPAAAWADAAQLAAYVKALPIRLTAPRPLEEAISSAGGVRLEALDAHLMLRDLPDVHCAGEMLDWEAPTGGYLLSACLASGKVAAQGVLHRLAERRTGQGSAPA